MRTVLNTGPKIWSILLTYAKCSKLFDNLTQKMHHFIKHGCSLFLDMFWHVLKSPSVRIRKVANCLGYSFLPNWSGLKICVCFLLFVISFLYVNCFNCKGVKSFQKFYFQLYHLHLVVFNSLLILFQHFCCSNGRNKLYWIEFG